MVGALVFSECLFVLAKTLNLGSRWSNSWRMQGRIYDTSSQVGQAVWVLVFGPICVCPFGVSLCRYMWIAWGDASGPLSERAREHARVH